MRNPEKRTYGEIWHEEAENESPVAAFLTFTLGMLVVISLIFLLPSEAHADELEIAKTGTTSSVEKTLQREKLKVKYVKKASKSYSKWKKNMTKDQRKAYAKIVQKMSKASTKAAVNKQYKKLNPYISRAKLCVHVNAKKFSNAKVKYVWKWGKRNNKYLKGSPMAGIGYLTAKWAYDTGMDPRLSTAIAKVESGKGVAPYGCKYNVWGWVWYPPAMYSWDDALGKWHRYFKLYFGKERYPIKSMHGYGGYGPWYVNQEMAKI